MWGGRLITSACVASADCRTSGAQPLKWSVPEAAQHCIALGRRSGRGNHGDAMRSGRLPRFGLAAALAPTRVHALSQRPPVAVRQEDVVHRGVCQLHQL